MTIKNIKEYKIFTKKKSKILNDFISGVRVADRNIRNGKSS